MIISENTKIMTNNKNSIHLQDFPNLNFVKNNEQLVQDMDLVRSICSSALSIRDNKNLRVRLPLNTLSVIGKNAARITAYKDIISEEVNVKNIKIEEDLEDKAELKLAINFKKIGATLGPKIKDIMAATKSGDWKKTAENTIKIADITLKGDDFSLKLTPKNHDDKNIAIQALADNSHLISLDLNVTEELKQEGLARDVIRLIQQARKDADLDVSDKINLRISSEQPKVADITKNFNEYIKEQVLAENLTFVDTQEINEKDAFVSTGKAQSADIIIAIIK